MLDEREGEMYAFPRFTSAVRTCCGCKNPAAAAKCAVPGEGAEVRRLLVARETVVQTIAELITVTLYLYWS